ncbi:HNH endonuclease signature motif containing protein [Cryobacterium sp. TMT4-31]|uniref:HNH endonuclease signature motif containing protein n=1 Tax=Cryobacterium sp. TMT4-31 TaxID=1259259 RepID=UPI00106C08C2|nr:HNH endonuclease signature motif containing protein [Cryobacterium sp. TMT4-31]TFC87028.1 HNH endonuclease [Cryobacterium sp. TMT4-31]
MTNQSSIADIFAASRGDGLVDAAVDVARLGSCSVDYDKLTDAAVLSGQQTLARAQRELDTRKAWLAKTLAQRSRWELGQSGLAAQQGFLNPEGLIQKLTGTSKVESRKLVGVGRMLAEVEDAQAQAAAIDAEAARRLLEGALDPDIPDALDGVDGHDGVAPVVPLPAPMPWHAPISHAVTGGTLSIDAAHALRTGLGDIDTVVTGPVLADALAGLLADAAAMDVDQLLKRARQVRDSLDEAGIRVREQKAWDDRYLRIWTLNTGQVRIDGLFPAEQGEFIKATFDSLTSPRRGGVRFVDTERAAWAKRVKNDPRNTSQITCDGFLDLLKAGTTINPNEMLGGRRPAVQILTTTATTARPAAPAKPAGPAEPAEPANAGEPAADNVLISLPGQTGHGYIEGNNAPVSPETIERLICDSGRVEITVDEFNRPLDLGHEQRLFNRAQRRALAARDGGCRWPGCDRPPAFTEAHHIEHWLRDHGRTDINQGILLCPAHHLLLHNQHWQIFENTGRYWLRPPTTIDPGQTLIEMPGRTRDGPPETTAPPRA